MIFYASTTLLPLRSLAVQPLGRINALRRYYSSNNDGNEKKLQKQLSPKSNVQKVAGPLPTVPSFMPVVNIPVDELAHSAFYSLHRPLFGLSTPRPFLAGKMVGQIKKEEKDTFSEEALVQYMMTLKPFEPPQLSSHNKEGKCSTTTLTVEIDPSYFLNHNNNHDEIADYLTAMQEKLSLLYDERATVKSMIPKKKAKRLRKRKRSFFDKN
ncbi:hypothetical protein BD560DRAFT_394460 [Blakeslea trispora]|nr:hypothetical protein BD560DRAFT_394460 [Blakeslea trispora]